MSMTHKIFKNMFFMTITIFLVSSVLLIGVMYGYFSRQRRSELRAEAQWLAAAVNADGMTFLETGAKSEEIRLTHVAADGTVLFDSAADPAALDSHAGRPEIAQALASGYGESVRHSATMNGRAIYCAVRLADGSVLRVSGMQYTMSSLIVNMFTQIVLTLVAALALSAFSAARMSRAITMPINDINLQNPDERDVYDELRPLVQRINVQNRQLQMQMEELRQEHDKQDAMRREFTANVSHELKTPLTSISGFAEILRDGLVKPEDVRRFAGNIYAEAQRLMELVNDILRLSRLDDHTAEVQVEAVDLYDLCAETVQRLESVAQQRGVTIHLDGAPTAIHGVRRILEEIVHNLCDNAVKYNRPGGEVWVTAAPDGDEAVLTVRDNGIGIPEADQPRVFERFYRVDKSHSREMGGTGLGLSIVKHGVQLHHGRIALESEPDVGTQITVIFPVETGFNMDLT